jgi:hypothetical protein
MELIDALAAHIHLYVQVLRAYIYVLLRAGKASLALDTIDKAIAQSVSTPVEVVNTEHTQMQQHEQQQEQSDTTAVVMTSTASAALLLYKADALLCLAESGYDSSSGSNSSTQQETSKHILDTTQAGTCYYQSMTHYTILLLFLRSITVTPVCLHVCMPHICYFAMDECCFKEVLYRLLTT